MKPDTNELTVWCADEEEYYDLSSQLILEDNEPFQKALDTFCEAYYAEACRAYPNGSIPGKYLSRLFMQMWSDECSALYIVKAIIDIADAQEGMTEETAIGFAEAAQRYVVRAARARFAKKAAC